MRRLFLKGSSVIIKPSQKIPTNFHIFTFYHRYCHLLRSGSRIRIQQNSEISFRINFSRLHVAGATLFSPIFSPHGFRSKWLIFSAELLYFILLFKPENQNKPKTIIKLTVKWILSTQLCKSGNLKKIPVVSNINQRGANLYRPRGPLTSAL